MIEYPDEWDDLPDDLRMQLLSDLIMFGAAYYEDTDDGYERRDPLEAAPDAKPDAVSTSNDVYGTDPVESLARRMATMQELIDRRNIYRGP